ncbi:ribonuclease Z [Pleionea sp. CnH1-48]|uniref:ribonuclease Z n=1 Tax=Pleionea sp. CnH1-48 TaxID=2954494 RepID=UPI0020971429|nr:ribonuclease Z [Pleionea sp. CnH1-48]MCO7225818.1 ribonuclease Z [Pleionea sp. CnH1-48]
MELLFLGTSSGVPTRTRNVSGLAVIPDGGRRWFLVDCGEGTQHQIQRTSLSLAQLSTIFITHVHGDHCFGLPGLLASASMSGRDRPLTIVGPSGLEKMIRTILDVSQTRFTYELKFIDVEQILSANLFERTMVDAFALSHRVESYAYRFTESFVSRSLDTQKLLQEGIEKGAIWGQIQRSETVTLDDGRVLECKDYWLPLQTPRQIVVGGDNDTPELLSEACEKAQVLVHEATYTQDIADKVGPAPQHSSAKQTATFAQSLQLNNLVLTHFSPRYVEDETALMSIQCIYKEAEAVYQGRLFCAKDFAHYRLKSDGDLIQLD